jgi:hypothetical protein
MAVLDRSRKVSEYNQGGHLSLKSSLKFLRFSYTSRQFRRRGGWGRRAGESEAEGRANQMKFDIFCKRPALQQAQCFSPEIVEALAGMRSLH